MTTPVFAELDQLREGMTALVGEARGLAASAEQLPGKIQAMTALVKRALQQTESVVSHATAEAQRVRRDVDLSVAQDTARAKEAAETKQKQLAEVAKVAAELKTLTADGDEVHAEIESLRERARIQAARDAQQARADLEAELEDVRAQVRARRPRNGTRCTPRSRACARRPACSPGNPDARGAPWPL